jgi:hypothetical protein
MLCASDREVNTVNIIRFISSWLDVAEYINPSNTVM